MSLDSRAREAVDETLHATGDVERGLDSLRRTRRQRAATRVGACAVVVALVLTGFLLRRHDGRPDPAPAIPHGMVLSLSSGGALEQVGSDRWPTLPARVDTLGPFSFTADGRELIYAWQRKVRAVDLATGVERVVASCPSRYCPVSVDPSGTRLATSTRHRLTVRDIASGEERHYSLDSGAAFVTWLPDGRHLAFLTLARGPLTLMRLDLDTGAATPLARIPAHLYAAPAWSPDGERLAFIKPHVRPHRTSTLTLMTVSANGGPPQAVHEIGRCYCIQYSPAVSWSPDGERLAVTQAGIPRASQIGGSVYTVRPDGTDWTLLAHGTYQDRLAWQPPVTSSD